MTIDQTQQQIIDEFEHLDDWFDRYEYLIDLGKRHEGLDESQRQPEAALPGCQSQVWIQSDIRDGKLYLHSDSDSMIIRGILALLQRALGGHDPADVAEADLSFLDAIGLTRNLSPTRANGVATIVRHIKTLAAAATADPPR